MNFIAEKEVLIWHWIINKNGNLQKNEASSKLHEDASLLC